MLHKKKRRLEAGLARKAAAIEDLLYSSKNFVTVKEELAQYDDTLKLIIKNHEEHCNILKQDRCEMRRTILKMWNKECSSCLIMFAIG